MRILYLIGGLALVIYGVSGVVFKERFHPLGLSTNLIFRRRGGIPWWLGAPFYVIAGIVCVYLAFFR